MSNFPGMAKVMDELMLDLMKRGVDIPGFVTDDLKRGRSLAGIYSRDPCEGDTAVKTMSILENVELNLLALADIHFGKEAAEGWQRRIESALLEQAPQAKPVPVSSFTSGAPRGDHWVRVQSDYLDTVDGARDLLSGYAVSIIDQDDGYLLIHGKKENVTAFLKEIRDLVNAESASSGPP